MIYVSFVVFSIGRIVGQHDGLTGEYETIFYSKSQAKSEFQDAFYHLSVIICPRQASRHSMTPVEVEMKPPCSRNQTFTSA